MSLCIREQVSKLGTGFLTEESLREHIWPLFSRTLARDKEIYLANHSLGRPLDQTADDVRECLDLWYERMDGSWEEGGWLDEMNRFRESIAKLIGLDDSSFVVPKTSAGQGLRAVLSAFPVDSPIRVVATRGEFDSIDFLLKAYAEKGRIEVRWIEPSKTDQGVQLFEGNDILNAIANGTDLLVLSQVAFATGQVCPSLDEAIAKAHSLGALALVDAYHAVGVMPFDMLSLDADFVIGGSYKYMRGGPGACWLAIHPRNVEMKTLDTGWFAKRARFGYERPELPERAAGGDAWLESTPPVLTFYQARAGLELVSSIGVERLREYGLKLLEYLRSEFSRLGVPCFHPADPTEFGAFALVPIEDAQLFSGQLRNFWVNTDARGNAVRFGPDILNTREEISKAAEISLAVFRK